MAGVSIPARFRDAEDALHEAATALSGGFTDFGPGGYREGLRVLLEAMDEEARILPERRAFAFGELALTLAARLHTEAGWKRHPEVLSSDLRAPLVIAGLPRSCTTVLQRLLAVDPQFQCIDSWLALAPQPRPLGDPKGSQVYQQALLRLQDWFTQIPHFRSAHDMAVDDPDECIEILRQDFVTNRFGCNFEVPSFDRWWLQQRETESYRRWANMLRLIGVSAPDRCWLLKNPGHIYGMADLLTQCPDARIVYTHRDPFKAMPSVASVVHMAHQIGAGDNANPQVVGSREVQVWSRGTVVMREARRQCPEQFFDVQHREYVSDPLAVVRNLYSHFDLTLHADVEQAMRKWLAANPQGKHGEHQYDLASYGLTHAAVADAFADYIDDYGPFD